MSRVVKTKPTLEEFKTISEYNLTDKMMDLVRRSPLKLLPLLLNHHNFYIQWAVKRRLEHKSFTKYEYLKLPLASEKIDE